MAPEKKDDRPLYPPWLPRAFIIAGLAVLAISLAVDLLAGHVSHFGFDGIPGFYAIFGLVCGFGIIGLSKAIGAVLKRPDSFYGDGG